MANLTTEYLDKALKKALKEQAVELKKSITTELKKSIVTELKVFIKEEIDHLARMTAKGFEDLEKRLDVKERVEKLERDFAQLKQSLHV